MAGASEVFAFSIGEFQVNSKFGQKFNASFEIELDFEGPVEVGIGKEVDYKRLGLERQDIIDVLSVGSAQPEKGLKRTVHIYSSNPLFFPSFNLVIWANHNGGTLLENFLVTVDFQQSLALNVGGKKKKTPPKSSPKTELSHEPSVGEKKPASLTDVDQLVTNIPRKDTPNVNTTEEQRTSPVVEVESLQPVTTQKASVEVLDKPRAITPAPVKVQVLHRRRLSGVIWAHPRPAPDLAAASPAQTDVAKVKRVLTPNTAASPAVQKIVPEDEQSIQSLRAKYVLKRGEGLFSIARKINVDKYHPAQIAVAIWMHNIDKFIFGNINGIREGVQLDLENLEDYISDIDAHTAGNILKSQLEEWNLVKNIGSADRAVAEKSVLEIPLPSERFDGLADIEDLFKQVNGWQDTWKNMDVEGHLSYYQTLEADSPLMIRKEKFMKQHSKPRLETSSKKMVLKEGIPMVFFEQKFSSEALTLKGLKELEWTRSLSGWKIRGETFYKLPSFAEKETLSSPMGLKGSVDEDNNLNLPFVIHVSSHADEFSAVSVTNRLRNNGYDAYWVPVRISKGALIYRVYLGRFADWNQAQRVVRILRSKPFGSNATTISYPFALQVGEVSSLKEARTILESLRKSGLSGLLLISDNESTGVHFSVVVGAFKKAANAKGVQRQLRESGFVGQLISP